jgi:hypothetical protein
MEDWESKILFERLLPHAESMFNFRTFDDFRFARPVAHEMYFKKMDEESIDILLNQANEMKRMRVRQLSQYKLLLQKASEVLGKLKIEYLLENN